MPPRNKKVGVLKSNPIQAPRPRIANNNWGTGGNNPPPDNTAWLINNPEFDEKPATMEQFLGPGYLDMDPTQNPNLPKGVGIRPGVKQALIDIFGDDIDPECVSVARRAMFTGGIGVGKSTLAAVALSYMVHWVSCLHDPQAYFELLPDSPIAFMIMSTKATQAREVLFGKVKAMVENSVWFKANALPNQGKGESNIKNQLRFPRHIWLVPGTSEETAFEGYDILGGVIDEGDSHKQTDTKDYAEAGWNTIESRISSRFTDPTRGDTRGLLMVMGQMKKQDGFMARKKKDLEKDDKAVVVFMNIWESRGKEYYRNRKTGKIEVFHFDIVRKVIVPPLAAQAVQSPNIIEIPVAYKKDFENDPVKALRDHAGIPPAVEDPFITAVDRIDDAQNKWAERFADIKYTVDSDTTNPGFHPDFFATDALKRAIHVDIAYASHGDAMGMAMGHVSEIVDVDGEIKPYIVIDFLLRMKPSGGQQLMLSDFRQIIYNVRDDLGFKIGVVTYDGFQSVDSVQILKKKKFNTAELSMDKKKGPYEDLRQAIYERRIEFPAYLTYLNKGDLEKVNIVKKELMELSDVGLKIDHPPNGSKDLADALAGVVHVLMGNNSYRRGAARGDRKVPLMEDDQDLSQISVAEKLPDEVEKQLAKKYDPFTNDLSNLGLPPIERDPFKRLRMGN
ncbi:terminase [Gordonia phage RobinSparkles]|nr:terminase [Gordonia phage RobinSparkles]